MVTKPWLKFYDEGVPHSLEPYPAQTLMDVLSDTVQQRPEHPCLLFQGSTLTAAELEGQSDSLAAALVNMGIQKGDRVALVLPNSPQMVVSEFGVWKAGAIAVPMNPLYTEPELEYGLKECGAETVIVLTSFYEKIKAIQARTPLQRVIATNIKEYLSPLMRFLFTVLKEKKDGHRIQLQPGDFWFGDLQLENQSAPRPAVTVAPGDPAIFLFSGGTTGTPKCAIGTHQTLVITGMQVYAWFKVVLEDWTDIIMLNMPLFHVYAQAGVMTAGFVGHCPLALIPNPRDLAGMLDTIKKIKPAVLPGVPTMYTALINHPKVQADPDILKSLKLSVSGAAPLMLETKERFETLTGGRIIEAYGLTESMIAAVFTPILGTYKPGAVGIPATDVELRVVDRDTGQTDQAPNEIGELLMRAPNLMKGYWEHPTETANAIRDGWLYTGDIGYLDEDGYMFIVDRVKDLIKPSGFQVWPRDVEEVLAAHPAVAEVGVAGVADAYQGEAVKAWVVLGEGQEITADELREYCRGELAAYKVPKHVEFRSSLPKSMVGKVLRRELVQSESSGEEA
jgi:long-chain acyl-CoA synthetase